MGRLRTKHHYKRNYSNLPIVNFPFICKYILTCWEYLYLLIRYSNDRWFLKTRKLLSHIFLVVMLKSSLWTFHSRHHDLVNSYRVVLSQITMICRILAITSSWMTYTTGATCGPRTAYPSVAHEFTPGLSVVRVAQSFVYCVVFM